MVASRGRVVDAVGIEVELRPAQAPGYAAIVALGGEHDISTIGEIRTVLDSIRGDVLLDLTHCAFLDSSVIHTLAADARARRLARQTLALVVPPDNEAVTRTLRLSGLSELLFVHPSTAVRAARPVGVGAAISVTERRTTGSPPAGTLRELRCQDCGFGAVVAHPLGRCPMCGGGDWQLIESLLPAAGAGAGRV